MALSVSLVPLSDSVAMYGSSNTSCSYSVAGTVNLTLAPTSTSLWTSTTTRPRNAIISSLSVIFEGKAEHFHPRKGYSAVRLVTVAKELVQQPFFLATDGEEASQVAFIFDLTVPGWLPQTVSAKDGNSVSLTSYSLFATATYRLLDDPTSSALCLLSSCLPEWIRNRRVHAPRVEINVVRHRALPPPSLAEHGSLFPHATFAVTARSKETSPIPDDVISKLRLLVSVPELVATNERDIPIVLKARCEVPGLRICHFDVDLEQTEHFFPNPDNEYTSSFPLPSSQPPNHPLLHRTGMESLESVGITLASLPPWSVDRPISDPKTPSRFNLEQDESDSEGGHVLGTEWSRVQLQASILGNQLLPKLNSPFLRVRHTLRVVMRVSFNGGEDNVDFSIPLQFVSLPAPAAPTPTTPTQGQTRQAVYSYGANHLPAYTQLFDDSGEAKIDPIRGVPPAYKDQEDDTDMRVDKPEYVPIGTQSIAFGVGSSSRPSSISL